MVISKGEVWWADIPPPAGSEPGFRRPVVVVQGDFASRIADVTAADLPELETVVVVGPPDATIVGPAVHDWVQLLDAAPPGPPPPAPVAAGDLACFIYTAGTTGPSKGCMLPHNYIVCLAEQIARAVPLLEERRHDAELEVTHARLSLQLGIEGCRQQGKGANKLKPGTPLVMVQQSEWLGRLGARISLWNRLTLQALTRVTT